MRKLIIICLAKQQYSQDVQKRCFSRSRASPHKNFITAFNAISPRHFPNSFPSRLFRHVPAKDLCNQGCRGFPLYIHLPRLPLLLVLLKKLFFGECFTGSSQINLFLSRVAKHWSLLLVRLAGSLAPNESRRLCDIINLFSQIDISLAEPIAIMGGESDVDFVVDIGPFWVVIDSLCHDCDSGHEAKCRLKIFELEFLLDRISVLSYQLPGRRLCEQRCKQTSPFLR